MESRNIRRGTATIRTLLITVGLATGCATTPNTDHEANVDPLERVNRGVYTFNNALDRALLKPTAKGYRKIVPSPVTKRLRNFINNFTAPVDIANNLLQGKFLYGFSDLGRFLFNSTIGLAGIFDPATQVGLERHPEDFGQTLAVWRVPQGPYLVLPFLGPSTVRDSIGLIVDTQFDPTFQLVDDNRVRNALIVLRIVTRRAQLLAAERAIEEALDRYIFIREAYLQRRLYLIHDGMPPEEEFFEEEFFEEEEDAPLEENLDRDPDDADSQQGLDDVQDGSMPPEH